MKCTLKEFVAYYLQAMREAYGMSMQKLEEEKINKQVGKEMWQVYMGIMSQGDDWHNV